MPLKIKPGPLTEFAQHAHDHAMAIQTAAQPMRVDELTLGSFDEATTLVDKLNNQIEDVKSRLDAVANTLIALGQVATDAASLAGASDSEVKTTMTRIKNNLQSIDLAQAAAAQKDRDEHPVVYSPHGREMPI